MSKPKLIAINHDDYHAQHIGRLADGSQFFLTGLFIPAKGDYPGREFIALFLFDRSGCFLEARIDDLGTREEFNENRASSILAQRLAKLGRFDYGRIEVQPFSVTRFGTAFGLIPCAAEDGDDVWAVELQPGNHMAFFEPWDSGNYST